MADLKRRHAFRRWAPDIGENRELEGGPVIWFEIATGLAQVQLAAVNERLALQGPALAKAKTEEEIKGIQRTAITEALGEFVRVTEGPHTVGGVLLATLDDYLGIVQSQADFGQLALTDLVAAFTAFNTFTGPDELFLRRRSGGLGSTGSPSVVKEEPKPDAP